MQNCYGKSVFNKTLTSLSCQKWSASLGSDEAENLFISVGVFIHWLAEDDKKIQEYNYQATKESIERAVSGEPKAKDVVSQKDSAEHPFAAK